MSMTQEKDGITFECDGCNDLLHTGTSNFDAARNLLRRERWHPVKAGDSWEHFCSDCYQGGEPGKAAA